MRATDEDQPGSRRPNLMSSARRSHNEINILDMLDRRSAGPLPRRVLRSVLGRPAAFRYGAAGLLVCAMVGTLAWLARDASPSSVDTVLAGSIKPAVLTPEPSDTVGNPPLAASPVAAAEPAAPEPAPEAAAGAGAGAAIVDLAPARVPETPAPVAAPPTYEAPPEQAAERIAAREVAREAAGLAAHAGSPKTMARTGRAASHGEPAATRRRRQAPAKTPPPAVDTDVALISAIIQHAGARQEVEEGACADKGCGARKP